MWTPPNGSPSTSSLLTRGATPRPRPLPPQPLTSTTAAGPWTLRCSLPLAVAASKADPLVSLRSRKRSISPTLSTEWRRRVLVAAKVQVAVVSCQASTKKTSRTNLAPEATLPFNSPRITRVVLEDVRARETKVVAKVLEARRRLSLTWTLPRCCTEDIVGVWGAVRSLLPPLLPHRPPFLRAERGNYHLAAL